MDIKHLAGAVAIATGLGLSTLPSGAGIVHAAPSDPPPPCVDCPPGPGEGPSQYPSGVRPRYQKPGQTGYRATGGWRPQEWWSGSPAVTVS